MPNFQQILVSNAKKIAKPAILASLALSSVMAYADPIEGNWVYYDHQKPRYIVTIKKGSQGFTGILSGGSRNHTGATVLQGLLAKGGGKYGGGQAYNPYDGSNYDVNLTLNGDVITMRAYKGFSLFGITTTLKRLPSNYTFTTAK